MVLLHGGTSCPPSSAAFELGASVDFSSRWHDLPLLIRETVILMDAWKSLTGDQKKNFLTSPMTWPFFSTLFLLGVSSGACDEAGRPHLSATASTTIPSLTTMSASRIVVDLTAEDDSVSTVHLSVRTTPRRPTFTRTGYLIDEFAVEDEDDDESQRALQLARGQVQRARRRRRQYAAEYERLAKRQRRHRIARGLPAEEEDNSSSSLGSSDTNTDSESD